MSKELDAVLGEEPVSTIRGAPIMVWLLAMASMYVLGIGTAYASAVTYLFTIM